MKTVICFYWEGDRWRSTLKDTADREYNHHLNKVGTVNSALASKYVNNLYRGVVSNSSDQIEFICFTNTTLQQLDKGIEVRRFKTVGLKGVLPRMYMFSEAAGLFGKQVLCIDIDVLITGSLDDILSYQGRYCTRESFVPGEAGVIDGDVQSFYACKDLEDIFWKPLEVATNESHKIANGRERLWLRHVATGFADTWQKFTPGQVVSYKFDIKNKFIIRKPAEARIISCHGFPRPHQLETKWAKQYWT
jgi:hypothetical protein